ALVSPVQTGAGQRMRTNFAGCKRREVQARMVLSQTFRSRSLPMLSIAELHPVLHDLFHDTADHLARQAGFCRRARKLTGPVFAQAVVFSLLHNPKATLDDFADTADELLAAPVTSQAFDKR